MDDALDAALLLTAEPLAWFTDVWRSQSVMPVDPPLNLSQVIPPHITLLSPWHANPDSAQAADRLRQATRKVSRFRLRFSSVETFPSGHVYLQPESSGELDALLAVLTDAFPGLPPDGGATSEWLPHLTVSRRGGEAVAREVREQVMARGPLDLEVGEVSAWEYLSSGRWIRRVTAPLAG